jgi:hypothetical protein
LGVSPKDRDLLVTGLSEVSFLKALEKVCTSITSGWWREFAWENYEAALAMHDRNYVDRFWKAVEAGTVGPYEG